MSHAIFIDSLPGQKATNSYSMQFKFKKWQIITAIVLLFFILTNPSIKRFKDNQGETSYSGLKRTMNFLVFSVYENGNKRYLGILSNFFYISPSSGYSYGPIYRRSGPSGPTGPSSPPKPPVPPRPYSNIPTYEEAVSTSPLNEVDRQKLDGIVQKMIDNKEPEDNIRFVVDDFKTKYSKSHIWDGEKNAPNNKESVPNFSARIKKKYPEYSGINDTILVERILKKYPVYSDMVDIKR